MVERRFATDIGLALLIALPFLLPATPGPHSQQNQLSTVASVSVAQHRDRTRAADAF